MDEIVLATAKAMVSEGIPFRGVLFAGLMIKNGKVSHRLYQHPVTAHGVVFCSSEVRNHNLREQHSDRPHRSHTMVKA